MIKIFGSILILISGTYMGFYLSGGYKKREKNLRIILSALNIIKTEISFCQTYMKDIFIKLSTTFKGDISEMFAYMEQDMLEEMRAETSFLNGIYEYRGRLCLHEWDIAVLEEFARGLGTSDQHSQLSSIDKAVQGLEENVAQAHDEFIKNAKMYKSFCVLSSVLVIILLL